MSLTLLNKKTILGHITPLQSTLINEPSVLQLEEEY